MDLSAISQLGQQLQDFLVQQFTPPPGTKNNLGFLGSGVAVDSTSFLSNGQFNPARINQWLSLVVDPLGGVMLDGHQVDFTEWTATELAQAMYGQAVAAAPPNSDDFKAFAKAKSTAMENMGGDTTVCTAPLDWYDPARVPEWPTYSVTTTTSTSTSTAVNGGVAMPPPGTPPIKPIWAWRKLDTADITATRLDVAEGAILSHPATPIISPIQRRMPAFGASAGTTTLPAIHLASAASAVQVTETAQSQVSQRSFVSVDRLPSAVMAPKTTPAQALLVSHTIAIAGQQASTSSVNTNSLTLKLRYRVVSLSRVPWWNEFFLALKNWYIPSLDRADLIKESTPQKSIGVPVALILTSDVSVTAAWSAADRTAAVNNTHLGPWALNSATFTAIDSAGQSSLLIPGMQAIACIFRELPALPPLADPTHAAAAAT